MIIPRWEWRTFGEQFDEADACFAALTPERVVSSDERYLVSRAREASVKVRDDLVDVKVIVDVSDDGLQQWKPVLKRPYPLSAADVVVVMEAAGVAVGPRARDEYTHAQLVDEVLRPDPDLAGLRVRKQREHYTVGGCIAERSEILTEHGSRRTIAVESEDPERVRAALRELGLASRPNVSLPRELQVLAGMG